MKSSDRFYFHGRKGKRNLLIIGLYPVNYDDFLSRVASTNANKIAAEEGFDGWIKVNLFPINETDKGNSGDLIADALIHYNIYMLTCLLEKNEWNFQDAWLMWGDGIEAEVSAFLKSAVGYLYGALLKFDLKYWCIFRTRRANPRDTSPETLGGIMPEIEPVNFIKFDFQHYVHYRKLSFRPEIMIK